MSVTTETPKDMFLSLNGFEELAITQNFGTDISELRKAPLSMMRAMVFVHRKRGGEKAPAAYQAAMRMPVAELQDYFSPEPSEFGDADQGDGDDEDADALGKG